MYAIAVAQCFPTFFDQLPQNRTSSSDHARQQYISICFSYTPN